MSLNNLILVQTVFSSFFGSIGDFAEEVFAAVKPAVDIVVPLVLTAFAGRFIQNKTLADAVATAAGVAYSHMGSIRTTDPQVLFEDAKRAGIEAGAAAINDAVLSGIGSLTPEQLNAKIDGALGGLLARDPTYSVQAAPAVVALQAVVAVPVAMPVG